MMQENGYIEIFERYRNGDLMEAELREFEARLAYDSEFKEAFDAYEQLELGIKVHFRNDLKLKLKKLDEKMDAPTSKKTSIKKLLIWSSTIAASILIGVMLFQHFSSNSSVQLAEQYWPLERGLPVKMSSKGKYDDAMNAFKLGEYDKSSDLLRKISTDTADYFLGVISYEQGDNPESKRYFGQIHKNSFYYHTAQFRLGLILLAEGNLASAKKIFNSQISKNKEFAEASKKILEKI
jgi:hypothetical protein